VLHWQTEDDKLVWLWAWACHSYFLAKGKGKSFIHNNIWFWVDLIVPEGQISPSSPTNLNVWSPASSMGPPMHYLIPTEGFTSTMPLWGLFGDAIQAVMTLPVGTQALKQRGSDRGTMGSTYLSPFLNGLRLTNLHKLWKNILATHWEWTHEGSKKRFRGHVLVVSDKEDFWWSQLLSILQVEQYLAAVTYRNFYCTTCDRAGDTVKDR